MIVYNELYMNKETGEILTKATAEYEFELEYDGGDDTNCIKFDDIYVKIDVD